MNKITNSEIMPQKFNRYVINGNNYECTGLWMKAGEIVQVELKHKEMIRIIDIKKWHELSPSWAGI